jgi:hypothetical protein
VCVCVCVCVRVRVAECVCVMNVCGCVMNMCLLNIPVFCFSIYTCLEYSQIPPTYTHTHTHTHTHTQLKYASLDSRVLDAHLLPLFLHTL